ncbi:Fc.00g093160.m01.CDS01 [Cosmosporella sp. VM-42]
MLTPSGFQQPATAPTDDVDVLDLEAQGYIREMPRQFSILSLMSMSYALLATRNGFGSAFGTGFTEASSVGSIRTLFIAGLMSVVTAAGMAELSTVYPVAGSEYCWSCVVSTLEWAPFASCIAVSISTFGWWLGLASVTNFVAAMVLGCVALYWEDYIIANWHFSFVFVLFTWIAVGLNIRGSRLLPM